MINSQNGMSIVEVMIAIGIMGIMAAGMASLQSGQMKEAKAVGEQLASLELQRTLTQVIASGAVCQFIFNDSANSSGLSATPPNATFTIPATYPLANAFTLTKIPSTASATSPVAAQVNQVASSYSNSLTVASIAVDITGVGANNQFNANLIVSFNAPSARPGSPVRQIKPISLPVILQSTVSGSTATVTNCTASGQMTPEICAGIGGTYNAANIPPCALNAAGSSGTISLIQPTNGVCPAGKSVLLKYWPAHSCGANTCTTAAQWSGAAPVCIYKSCITFTGGVTGNKTSSCSTASCSANLSTSVICF